MNYVADTVARTRHFSEVGKIGLKAKKVIKEAEQGKHTLFISVVSLFEIMYLAEKNRIKISLKNTVSDIQRKSCYSIVNLNTEIILKAETIKFYELHDRLILGTAKYLNLDILSSDERFDEVGDVNIIW
jgi:PIN domain nuclease of toxin-antitoxin system